ncbi:zinc finger imprinted 3-like [Battus philenor]|uniref:zinc finger imprinted 3-like n=1 Tax=Battus philenor TaxID=42288 RepID=UPI0035CFBD7C
MDVVDLCRCCLARPPDKDLKTVYTRLGKTEIYGDMLKECFEIHLTLGAEGQGGVCDTCVTRLRDAADFKEQVVRCQKEFQLQLLSGFSVKGKSELSTKVKLEVSEGEDESGVYFIELKEELSDEELKVKEDADLAAMLGLDDVSIQKKMEKRNGKKMLIEDRKSSQKNLPLKLSFRTLSQIDKLKSVKTSRVRFVSDNNKHKINLENILKYSNCTPFSNKTIAGIACAYCKEVYQDPQDLRIHNQEVHRDGDLNDNKRMDKNNLSIKLDITDLKCTICNTTVDFISNLKKHLTSEHNIKFYSDVKDYILEFKLTSSQILNCALCNSTYETFKMLLQHMNGHYRNYICDICDMGFINQHRLKSHKRTHEVGTFKCSYCEKIFSTRVRKMCHEKYTHNTSARYTTNCPQCDQSFTSYYQRNRHMFKDHNTVAASYKCNICDKSFILKSKLTSHIKKVHLMERNHICEECGQGFFIKQSLDEHMVKHKGERVFKCTVCNKAYARKKTLREHMRIHNNDRRFKCGVCSMAFVQKCSLKGHMLSNHGVTLTEFENNRSD